MKVAYLAQYDGNPNSGVTKKLLFQITAMNENGAKARLIFLTSRDCTTKFDHSFVEFEDFPTPPYKNIFTKFLCFFEMNFFLKKIINKIEKDEIIYFRNFFPFTFFKNLISKHPNIFIDVPSNNIKEAEIRKSKLYKYLYLKNGSNIANRTRGITSVTQELIFKNFPDIKSEIPVFSIGNGFDISSINVEAKEGPTCNKFHFICVANFSFWHGIDRFLYGLASYKEKSTIKVHLVGNGPELKNIKKIVEENHLENNVVFHGFLADKELQNVYNLAHIAIGNLGTHRKGITYTSPLKSREYCARGIPFIYTCIDDDFPEYFPYALKLAQEDTPVCIREILEFYSRIKTERDFKQKMRIYAEEKLAWNTKMKQLLEFFERNSLYV